MTAEFIVILTSTLDIFIVLIILMKIFGAKRKTKYTIINTILFVIIGIFLVMFEFYFRWNYYIYLHGIDMLFFITIIYSAFVIGGNFFSKFTIITLIYCSLAIIYNLSYYICRITLSSVQIVTYLIVNFIITKLLFIFISYVTYKYKIKSEYNPPFYYWNILISIPLLNFCVSFILENSNISSHKFAFMLIGMLIINILLYISFSKIISDYEDKILCLMDKQYLKLQLQSYEENQKVFILLNKFKHDLKNHMLCMQIMLKNHQFEELDNYFLQLSNETSKVITQFNTGNTVVDTVLSAKIELANFHKIPVDIEIPNPIEFKINDFELCAVLSNLLDNAIEASSKIKEPKIKIKISSLCNCMVIIISNRANDNILINNSRLMTTKKDKVNHGIGLSIVDDIVKKYRGTISFYMDSGYFNVNIVMPK